MTAKQCHSERERFWRAALAAQQVSRLTVRGYCRQNGLVETAFHYWRSELQRRDAGGVAAAFVPVAWCHR